MNKIYSIFLALSIFNITSSFAQHITIKISGVTEKAVLFQLEGVKTNKIDSVISSDGTYQFSLKNKNNGFYRLQLDNKHWIDFINDGKDVKIKTDYNRISALSADKVDNLKVIQSESNKLYFEFIKINKAYKTKTELLDIILANYPKDDNYYTTTQNKLLEIQYKYRQFVKITSQKKPKTFIARYIKSAQLPIIDIDIPVKEQLTYFKNHSLGNIDFNDDELIHSDLFTNKSIEYLTYYRNPRMPKALLEKEFIKAVDTLLNKAKVNEFVYQQMVEYLIDGFRKFGFEKPLDYIVDNYVIKDNICLDLKLESSLQRRITQASVFKIGKTVPNIVSFNSKGKKIDLNKINGKKILILFYASWCPHCKEIVPEISRLYKKQKENNTEVLAISVDTNKTDWINFVKANKLNWINVSDLKGWYGKAANDYYLYATPTMFLVDKNKKVLAKPSTIEELRQWF